MNGSPYPEASINGRRRRATMTRANATSSASDLAGSQHWPEPKPLPDGLAAVAAFDIAFLPESVAPWVADIADRMQCPPDFVARPGHGRARRSPGPQDRRSPATAKRLD